MTLTRILLFALLAMLVALVAAVSFAWAPDQPVERLKPRWAAPPSTFIDLQGMAVHLRDEGRRDDAEPVVLLHGTSASLHTWDGWVAELARERRVIRVDLPGFGLTGPHPAGTYGIGAYTRFVIDLMDRLGVQRAVLVGNSLGGHVAWKTAHDHPDRVSRLILIDAAGYAIEPESVPLGFRLARSPVLAPVASHLLTRGTVAASLRNVYGNPALVTPELVERYHAITLRAGNRRAVAERFRQMQPGEHAPQIRAIAQPTLILWGGKDRLIPLQAGQRFSTDIRNSRLVVFDDLGHVPQEEDPARTVRAAMAFLRAVPGGSVSR